MLEDKYIGLVLAITSSLAIGSSFILTKMGLNAASEQNNFEGAGYEYLKNPIWWGGMATMAIGEVANFAAYTFAPAIMVTPLGALSVIIGAILAAVFLKEELGTLGKLGCTVCLLGSVIIILHAPSDKDIQTVDEILGYALQPAFLCYALLVAVFTVFMITRVVPTYGTKNPIVYISICSTVGSISVMSIKAFGIALKLTLSGNNQFTHLSTYFFITVVVVCIMTQMNYFNKALDQFDTSIVNPLYYVTFTTATLVASFILYRNFDQSDHKDSVSLVCGFLIIFTGVYLLNLARKKNHDKLFSHQSDVENIPLDNNVGGFTVRKSFQGTHHRVASQTYQSEEMVHLTRDDSDIDRFRV
ncbi:LANO_0F13520g1_1 [Lachancea nothofagi CBS 11611]|uniref:LANO_0F13520g1_1 n=1 Tax=Lachancea nothofagi CBS 11611 TaxID=1266666 RepID=A0A1G4KBU0_9SACH|nr:LANO_0F13520g1_1 [Lachancea nothofagi CBS 11611]